MYTLDITQVLHIGLHLSQKFKALGPPPKKNSS